MRKPTRTLVAFAAVAALAGCGGQAESTTAAVPAPVSPAELANVTLKVGDQKGGVKSLLTAAGLLGDLPYKIEFSTFTSGPPLLEAASAGAIDIGRVGNTPPIFAAAADAKISVVAAAQAPVFDDALLVPPDSPVQDLAGLKGKTIGVAKGSSAHGQVLYNLRAAGLSTKDVKLSYLQPADAFAAFNQKAIDAWAVWDPYTSQAQQESNARVLADGVGKTNGYVFQVAGRDALADPGKNSALREYVARVAKAQKWADTHRPEWAAAWAAETGLKPEVTNAATARGVELPVALDDQVLKSQQDLANAFSEEKLIPGAIDFAAFADQRYSEDLRSAREK
ncbi:ABC transporter substrate-binding protein [Amycolatopsis sp. 195334CR]|uniref:ABC transporter substrate-binding protein n=1 Tax=Amycolatopsis sp. 195334CR TaxID=2814588 RepID=UPI001A8E2BD7|nr:ABC transporter substrate-binding protein [Amycolatopsis sp. 195334CR]MBN6033943.1 ABC transporter substrate-binding protein [Amycolatopsis sp. 195334CR]